jgi:hypothetical protein
MALAMGTSAHAKDDDKISAFCKGVLSQLEEKIAANGPVVTASVQGGTVQTERKAYLRFLRNQLHGRANNCLRFVVQDKPDHSRSKPVAKG